MTAQSASASQSRQSAAALSLYPFGGAQRKMQSPLSRASAGGLQHTHNKKGSLQGRQVRDSWDKHCPQRIPPAQTDIHSIVNVASLDLAVEGIYGEASRAALAAVPRLSAVFLRR